MVSLRIIYFGTPQFAVPALEQLINSRHEVVAVVSQPDRPRGRGHQLQVTPTKSIGLAAGIPVLQPLKLKDSEFLSTVTVLRADLGVVAAYGRILPDALLAIPRLGMINVHGSLLPKYRGAAPVHRAVINGDAVTGISIMRVVKELDAGPVFTMGRLPIGMDDTTTVIERSLSLLGGDLALEVVDALSAGTPEETPQDDGQATYAPKIEKHDGAIDWNQPALRMHNLIRGLQPWPLVSGRLNGVRFLVHRSVLSSDVVTEPGGTVVRASDGVLALAGSDGRALHILELQPEGKRPMAARDFLSGHRVAPGVCVEPA
ncbi:MAG: methionyl-tRNA formyltransferase [Vicinamibacterales bacterium]